jgi:chemotaxis protein methyltransferase CheR
MQAEVFRRFCEYALKEAGISLGPQKEALVAARVGKRMHALGLPDEAAYLAYLESEETGQELVRFLDVISTNHTAFFREPDHFEFLRSLVSNWYREGQRTLRIWSAASSTGEEPYTIAMTVRSAVTAQDLDLKILATDISTRVLAAAEAGIYPPERIESVASPLRKRFFAPMADGSGRYQVRPELRRDLVFRRLNLSQPPFPMRGPLDVVFCRNVLIYFDQKVRHRLISAIEGLLKPGGWLFIGHSETLAGISSGFRALRPSVFQLAERPTQTIDVPPDATQDEARPTRPIDPHGHRGKAGRS